jgi:hypothetical protein
MTTANIKVPEISESQSAKSTTHNEALHILDALVNCSVIDRDLTAPPGSPVDGDVYIPKATATGAWSGKENQLAQWDVNAWKFHAPEEGWICYVRDEDVLLVYTGAAWTVLAGASATAPFVDSTALAKGSADATKLVRLEVDGLTTGTTRVATVPDKSFTMAGTDDTAAAQAAAEATAAAALATHVAASDPHTGYQKESEKGAASGYASLDSGTLVPAAQLPALVGDLGSGGTKGAAPAPAAGDAAASKFLKADGTWAAVSGAAGGTVTSVALTVPAELSVSGSPVTSSGTLAVTKANQSANQVFAGPTSGGAAAPAFRALVAADVPAVSLSAGVSGTLPVANGGTGQTTQTAAFDALDPLTTKGDVIVHNGTNSVRLPVGTNAYVLTADSTLAEGIKWAAAGAGGGLTNFVEAKNTTSPNATIPVESLSAAGAETNIDVAFKPKGTGAITAHISDGATAGGNKRGTYATDWQRSRGAADQVASGNYSVIGGGDTNKATNLFATVAGGSTNEATGSESFIGGGTNNIASANDASVVGGILNSASGQYTSIGGGYGNQANADYSTVPGGQQATTRGIKGRLAYASGQIGTKGDAQWGKYVIRRETTDATASALTSTGGAASTTNGVILPNNSTYTFKGLVSARNTANGDSSGWEFTGVIKRGANAAATALVAAVTPTLIAQDAGAATWVLAVTADTTNGGLSVTVTGVAATTIRWVATIDTTEVTN